MFSNMTLTSYKHPDIVSNSPWTNTEDRKVQVKEGDKFVVTYDGLNQSSMIVENEASAIKRVVLPLRNC